MSEKKSGPINMQWHLLGQALGKALLVPMGTIGVWFPASSKKIGVSQAWNLRVGLTTGSETAETDGMH